MACFIFAAPILLAVDELAQWIFSEFGSGLGVRRARKKPITQLVPAGSQHSTALAAKGKGRSA